MKIMINLLSNAGLFFGFLGLINQNIIYRKLKANSKESDEELLNDEDKNLVKKLLFWTNIILFATVLGAINTILGVFY